MESMSEQPLEKDHQAFKRSLGSISNFVHLKDCNIRGDSNRLRGPANEPRAELYNVAKEYVKKKIDEWTGEEKVVSKTGTEGKLIDSDSVDDGAKLNKRAGGYNYGVGESVLVKYQLVISKNRRGVMKLIVGVVLGLALGLFIRYKFF